MQLHDTSIFAGKGAFHPNKHIIRRKPHTHTHTQILHYSLLKNAHTHTRGTEQEMMSPTQPGEMRSAQKRIKTNLNAPI